MTDQNVKITLTGNAQGLIAAFKQAGVSVGDFDKQSSQAAKGFKAAWGEMKGLAGELGLAMGLGQVVSGLQQFTAASYDAALAQKDMKNALTDLVGGSTQYEDAIRQVQEATNYTVSETDAARTAFGLLDNGIAKSAEEAAKYARAGKALNAALGETASYEKFLMLLDDGSQALLNNFNITSSAVQARQAEIMATDGVSESEARLTAVRQLALEKGTALADSISDETEARQQATASYANFQAAFGNLVGAVEQGLGVMEKATWAFNQMGEGAKAYTWILNEGIPAIQAHNAAVADASTQAIVAAQTSEELAAAMAGGVKDYDMLRQALITGSNSYDEYIAKMDEMIQIGVTNLGWTDQQVTALLVTKEQYEATKVKVTEETAALLAQNGVLAQNTQAMRLAGEAAYYQAEAQTAAAQAAIAANGATNAGKNAQSDRWAGLAGADEMTQARVAGLDSLDVQRQEAYVTEAKIDFTSAINSAKKAADDTRSAFEGAFNTIKGMVDNQLTPSLDEVWKPPEAGTENIDEAARRLATVSTSGFSSEWLTALNQQFAGLDFWQPISEAMASGDEGALKSAADDILLNNVTKLWDIEAVKENVKRQLQEQNARQQIMDTIMAELTAEGVVGAQAAAEGASSAANAGLLGQMMGDPATAASGITATLIPAIDTLKQSLAGLGGAGEAAGEAAGAAEAGAGGGSAFAPLLTDAGLLNVMLGSTLTETITTLQTNMQTSVEDMLTQMGLLHTSVLDWDTVLAAVKDSTLPTLKTAGEQTAGAITAGMADAAETIDDDLIKAIKDATKAFEKMADAARDAARASDGAGSTAPGGSSWGGGRASGGAVSSNSLYLVGEEGPELFSPGSDGYIVPFRDSAPAALAAATGSTGGGSLVIENLVLQGMQNADQLFDEIVKIAKRKGVQLSPIK